MSEHLSRFRVRPRLNMHVPRAFWRRMMAETAGVEKRPFWPTMSLPIWCGRAGPVRERCECR